MYKFNHFYYTECNCGCNRRSVWGVLFLYTFGTTYIVWGSPSKPQIRPYYSNGQRNRLSKRILEKSKSSKHHSLDNDTIGVKFPEVISEVEQYILMKMLKNGI